MMAPSILAILCCPETHQPLTPADPALIARLNDQIKAGVLQNRAGKPVTKPIGGGLVRQDGQFVYPVRNEIPVLLIDEGIPLEQKTNPVH